jgi:tetratricopeptide (TPR) repeat protein
VNALAVASTDLNDEPKSGLFVLPAPSEDAWSIAARLVAGAGPLEILDAGLGASEDAETLVALGHSVTRLASEEGPTWTAFARPVPLLDEMFDIVVLAEGLEQMPDLPHAAAELARLLKPGALLVATRPVANGALPCAPRCGAEDLAGHLIRAGLEIKHVAQCDGRDVVVAVRDEEWGPALAEASRILHEDSIAASRALATIELSELPNDVQREVLLMGVEAMLAGGAFEGALDLASGADRIDTSSARAMIGLARVAMAIGDAATALAACLEASRRAPDSPYVWHAMSETHEALGDQSAATAAMERALASAPVDLGIVRAALDLAHRQGAAARAEELATRAGTLEEWIGA